MRIDAYGSVQGNGVGGISGGREGLTMKGDLSSYQKGDRVDAEVLSSEGGELRLRLADGSEVTALRTGEGGLQAGDRLRLLISDRVGQTLTAELIGFSEGQGGDPGKLLEGLGLPVTPEHIEIVESFLQHGIPLTKENIDIFANMLIDVRGVTAENAAFLIENGVNVNTETVSLLNTLNSHETTISNSLESVISLLEGALLDGEVAAEAPPAQSAPPAAGGQSPVTLPGDLPVAAQMVSEEASALPQATLPQGGAESTGMPPDALSVGVLPSDSGTETPVAAVLAQPEAAAADPAKAPVDASVLIENLPDGQAETATAARPDAAPIADGRVPTENGRAPEIRPDVRPELAEGRAIETRPAPNAPVRPENIQQAAAPTQAAPTEVLANTLNSLRSLYLQLDGKTPLEITRELRAGGFHEQLGDALKALVSSLPLLKEPLRRAVEGEVTKLTKSLELVAQLDRTFSEYVQLPVVINGEKSSVELYVFSDGKKKNKKIDPKNATVFLSLGTANLGRVESFIKVTDKVVECDFTLENRESAEFMKRHGKELYPLLESAGYTLRRLSFAEWKPAEIPEIADRREAVRRRYVFDIRV
ncbi:flagellar hook-length control protein FliK [Oscillospiraceae bacterium OttesenSCG-928-G22]|nr:flagellar hook-length control protein FliK [Oscillospiraceae bacterium OttesenSCG-928-G22]